MNANLFEIEKVFSKSCQLIVILDSNIINHGIKLTLSEMSRQTSEKALKLLEFPIIWDLKNVCDFSNTFEHSLQTGVGSSSPGKCSCASHFIKQSLTSRYIWKIHFLVIGLKWWSSLKFIDSGTENRNKNRKLGACGCFRKKGETNPTFPLNSERYTVKHYFNGHQVNGINGANGK